MSDAVVASTEDQEPLPKRQKLCGSSSCAEDEEAAADGGARPEEKGETPSNMLGGLLCKFLKEADVGITEYVSPQPGFFAILKQRLIFGNILQFLAIICRYSDFIVREISSSGEVVKLTSLSPPVPPVAVGDGEGAKLTDVFSSGDIDQLRELASGNGGSQNDAIEIKVGFSWAIYSIYLWCY